jgi:aryl-alcohol dehydrogenase-like predicted oxidoreductase
VGGRDAYRSLGRTGVQVSALSFGSMLFGSGTTAAESARLVDLALDDDFADGRPHRYGW